MFTRKRSEEKTQKWRCVFTFYSAFRRALWRGNLHAYGDAKVCEIRCSVHSRRLGGNEALPHNNTNIWEYFVQLLKRLLYVYQSCCGNLKVRLMEIIWHVSYYFPVLANACDVNAHVIEGSFAFLPVFTLYTGTRRWSVFKFSTLEGGFTFLRF